MARHWSCESCGKDTTDKPGVCDCGCESAVCQVCWHGPEPVCQNGEV